MTTREIITETERQNQLDSDQPLLEMFLTDHIENQVQRLMEHFENKSGSLSNYAPVKGIAGTGLTVTFKTEGEDAVHPFAFL